MDLTGIHNPLVKAAAELKQKKYRQQQGLFLAEGLRTVEEAVAARTAQSVFYTAIEDDRTRAVLERAAARQIKLYCVSDGVMKKIADTETPQGIIAVCAMQSPALEQLVASGKLLLVLDRVGDPGNLGTMLRTADAAGIGGVILLKGCADIYAPKAVRSSMGSLFHLPVLAGVSEEELVSGVRRAGYQLLVTCLDGADNLYKADLSGRLAFVMGNEANGVSAGLLAAADKRVYIPMQGRAESLNVAMAAGIVMFEALRRQMS
ncbi:MAG: RNA methyltransferase [Phascolarctobacterium sp.]|uniref:TrmH family RNA methyltransferase n=1 Tax=Phascolarctobacterium sp. TaxID=2049039 RepID=UPI0026DA860D|nr:RNA methyltransferase [Phascolarctobacterium sp.]MDO4920655.1 RNA methyltransferase [Phascolarctobacterium sp.]